MKRCELRKGSWKNTGALICIGAIGIYSRLDGNPYFTPSQDGAPKIQTATPAGAPHNPQRAFTPARRMLVTQDSTENPRVLTWGRGQYGQLGHNSQPADEVLAPTAVPCLEGRPVARLACGQFHTAAVVAGPKGSRGVLTWGRGTLGVLGHGDEEDRLEPQAVELLTGVDVRSVACGAYQTAAVTRAGELFCWGWQFEDGPSGSIQELSLIHI